MPSGYGRGRRAMPNLISDEDVASVISSAVEHNPDVHETVADLYARSPQAMLVLDQDVQGEILKTLAANKIQVLESLDVSKTAARPEASEGIQPAPPPRYACVQLYEEGGQPWEKGAEFDEQQLFREKHWCLAEVSVQLKPKGVRPKQTPRPIREPRQMGPVDILVTAQSRSTDFEISPRVGKLVLPERGSSTEQALFRFMPLRCSQSATDKLWIRFSLFYKFNLLQSLTVTSGVLPELDIEGLALPFQPPAPELLYEVQSDVNDFDLMPPRALHIDVTSDGQQYEMVFTFKRDRVPNELAFHAGVPLIPDQLANEIADSRRVLFDVVSTPTLDTQIMPQEWEYNGHLAKLAERGKGLWSLLFHRGEGQEISTVGEFLKNNPLPEGSTIQVSVSQKAASFTFPWSLLYDKDAQPDGPQYTADGFWGIRYIIEQRLEIPTPPARDTPDFPAVEIAAMYWNFSQTPSQQEYLASLVRRAKAARLALGGPITEPVKALQCLKSRSSHIMYFFTHGYTGLPGSQQYGVTIEDVLRVYDKLPAGLKGALRYVADDVRKKLYEPDKSWIQLTSGSIMLDDLYPAVNYFPLRPFVILNMCESAQVTPALALSFIDFFVTRGARAVIGTECSMRPVFADFVGRELLYALLAAVPIGDALWHVRMRAAKDYKNLLGLAYTLFGSAEANLNPALLPWPPGP